MHKHLHIRERKKKNTTHTHARTGPQRLPRVAEADAVLLLVAEETVHNRKRPVVQLDIKVFPQVALQELNHEVCANFLRLQQKDV